jgi:hypothetical protein
MNFQTLPIWQIQRDPSNVRQIINRNNVETMKNSLRDGRHLPLISVRMVNGQYLCTDGMHRLTAYRELGFEKISVELNKQNDLSAQQSSFWQNEGMNNSEFDRANFFLQQYQQGIFVTKMVSPKIKEEKVRQYIRWGYWLAQEVIKQDRTLVPDKIKNTLVKYEKSFQRDLLNYFLAHRSFKDRMDDNWIRNTAVEFGIRSVTRYIKDIPRNAAEVSPKVEKIKDPIDEYLISVYKQLIAISQDSGRTLNDLF